jgi:hypothetical protein
VAPLLILAALAALAAAAPPKKPFVEPGTRPNPEEVAGEPEGARPDDKFADVRLEVDAKGRPTRCTIVKTSIRDPMTRIQICNSFMVDWHLEPRIENGAAIPQTVMRHVVMRGKRHR